MRAVRMLREKGIRAGLLRPITLYPFPTTEVEALVGRGVKKLVVVELNMGQMLEDVRLATAGRAKVDSLQRLGGVLPSPQDIVPQGGGNDPMIASEGHYEVKLGKLPTLTDTPTHYCPGCEHGTLTRLIASALDKLRREGTNGGGRLGRMQRASPTST